MEQPECIQEIGDLPKLRDSLCARTVVPASTARTLESACPSGTFRKLKDDVRKCCVCPIGYAQQGSSSEMCIQPPGQNQPQEGSRECRLP